jgi:hypothetical protein
MIRAKKSIKVAASSPPPMRTVERTILIVRLSRAAAGCGGLNLNFQHGNSKHNVADIIAELAIGQTSDIRQRHC